MGKGSHKITDKIELEAGITFANSQPKNSPINIGENFVNGTWGASYDPTELKDKYKGEHGGLAESKYGDQLRSRRTACRPSPPRPRGAGTRSGYPFVGEEGSLLVRIVIFCDNKQILKDIIEIFDAYISAAQPVYIIYAVRFVSQIIK